MLPSPNAVRSIERVAHQLCRSAQGLYADLGACAHGQGCYE